MKKNLKKAIALTLCALTLLATVGCSSSDPVANYPEKEIRVIVNYTAGGQSDVIARKLVDVIQSNGFLDQTMVVVNMSGGNTSEGINALLEADPDGYTLMFHHTSLLTLNAVGQIDTTIDDLDFVCGASEQSFMLVAQSDYEYDDIADIIDVANADPTAVDVGFAGFAGAGHFALLDFLYKTETKDTMKQITYAGGAEAIQAQLGGQVTLRATNAADAYQYITSGDLKPVAILADQPSTDFPEVTTLGDLGYDGGILLRSGFFAPKDTPDEIKDIISEAVAKAVATDEFIEFAASLGTDAVFSTGDEFYDAFAVDMENILVLTDAFSESFA